VHALSWCSYVVESGCKHLIDRQTLLPDDVDILATDKICNNCLVQHNTDTIVLIYSDHVLLLRESNIAVFAGVGHRTGAHRPRHAHVSVAGGMVVGKVKNVERGYGLRAIAFVLLLVA
jgi:hypothetical protein